MEEWVSLALMNSDEKQKTTWTWFNVYVY
jgi:hypothetical protein